MHNKNKDIAIVIAWPDCLARGDGSWYKILKDLNIVKNLNFKVGHAAMILTEQSSGKLHYFDFGRYIAPRGYGRVRGANTDPGLYFPFKAKLDKKGNIINLKEVIDKMQDYKGETHGYGKMFFSLCREINFEKSMEHIARLQEMKYIEYGAVVKDNTNCSRFVCDAIRAGYVGKLPWRLRFPETIMPSTMGNVVNARTENHIYFYEDGELTDLKFNRWDSLKYFFNNLRHNTSSDKAKEILSDEILGSLHEPEEFPDSVPEDAQWLGGLGEGAWHHLSEDKSGENLNLARYKMNGNIDFSVTFNQITQLDLNKPYSIKWGTQAQLLVIEQMGEMYESQPYQGEMAMPKQNILT